MEITTAIAARDEGIARSADHAERVHPGFGQTAFDFLERYARLHASFTAEAVRQAYDEYGLVPAANPKAWGSVFVMAARCGIIAKGGYGVAVGRHASICVRWDSLVHRGHLIALQVAGDAC